MTRSGSDSSSSAMKTLKISLVLLLVVYFRTINSQIAFPGVDLGNGLGNLIDSALVFDELLPNNHELCIRWAI